MKKKFFEPELEVIKISLIDTNDASSVFSFDENADDPTQGDS